MFSNIPGGNMLNNIGGNISSLGEKAGGGLGGLSSKIPGNLNPTNLAGNFTGTTGAEVASLL